MDAERNTGKRFYGQCICCKTTAPATKEREFIRASRGYTNPTRMEVWVCSNCGCKSVIKSVNQSNLDSTEGGVS